ncbi:serine hydrolase domain-containing protein [Kutzneria kofuensis]|uniref:CubicO group peptidase (Beta-lactamase class C family) n=1 Tax=Kutzneria kofuensis TaxID=103725 RepID=A0A7W9KRT2_9PSEU|nr:serine hydrolase domain-containing protein [Kutzneria kofuensis]MBB5897540.1 CubicO group peptidase (beta-lactamase class C family) [Kutzneria kofuensis]
MDELGAEIDRVAAATSFSGVVRLDEAGTTVFERAYGLAHRGLGVPNTVDTRFAIASGTKPLTALTVMSLVEDGTLDLSTTARSVLGADLPLIDDAVTVEQLLAHRSGIGDYYDEHSDPSLPLPAQDLETTEQYVPVLDGHPMKFPPGTDFRYNNGAFVVLALIAERTSGVPFHDLVARRVCAPAGMADTAFLRTDEPDRRTALGYLDRDGLRTNVFQLPVRGNGDGGIYTTAADFHALWRAFFTGRIVSAKWVDEMVRPRSVHTESARRYGLGFWLHESSDVVLVEGYDPGVSFRSVCDPSGAFVRTVVGNTASGAWPVARLFG